MNFWDVFESFCLSMGKKPNPVAKEIGVSSGTVTKWKNGAIPNGKILSDVADYFGCSVDELLGRKKEPEHDLVHISQNKVRMIPVFASISAGVGVYANSEVLRYEPVYIEND